MAQSVQAQGIPDRGSCKLELKHIAAWDVGFVRSWHFRGQSDEQCADKGSYARGEHGRWGRRRRELLSVSTGNDTLSPRELEIARAYAGGASYREVAERLFIAPTTVRTHLSTIYRKLGVSSKIDLLRTLERHGSEPESPRPWDSQAAVRDPASVLTGRRQVVVLSAMSGSVIGENDMSRVLRSASRTRCVTERTCP